MGRPMTSRTVAAALVALAALASAPPASAKGNADNGKELATKKYICASCHGADFKSPIDPTYPKHAGQHYDYLRFTLIAYQRGEHPVFGRTNAVMASQAKPLSATEIDDIAAYLASLPPSLVLKR